MKITRRHAVLGTMAGSVAGCATSFDEEAFTAKGVTSSGLFRHGVASGDPALDSVVLWTRITTKSVAVPVTVEVSGDATFATGVKLIRTETSAARDHTVKVIADGLEPGKTYHYRFSAGGEVSPKGRTKTLPEKAEKARFAVCSCSNYPFGFFNAYDHMARQDDLDAVIHLGDYIYEYGPDGYGGEDGAALGRPHTPAKEIVTLADYRARHAQYKSDPGAQAMHAAHAFIAIWDDHETTNNSWDGGAENHQPETEGDWAERQRAALQAYYEWMPVRDPEPGRAREALYKSYTWGGLLTLATIETRLTARTKQIEYAEVVPTLETPEDIARFRATVLNDAGRELIGPDQMGYLEIAIGGSVQRGEPWRMVANQVIMARVTAPNLDAYVTEEQIQSLEKQWDGVRAFIAFSKLGLPLNLDAWDGYPAARERFYQMSKAAGAQDLVVLTGDTHEAWGNDLYNDADERMGIELGTTSVTSPGSPRYLGDAAFDFSLIVRNENRDVRFHDPMSKGYLVVSFDGDTGQADYVALSTVTEQQYTASVTARMDLVKRNGTVEFANARGLGFKERVLF